MTQNPAGPAVGASRPGLPPLRVAGMALQNGLLVYTSEHWAAAIRLGSGPVQTASGVKPVRLAAGSAGRWPLLRGVLQLADALALLPEVKRRLGGAVLPMEAPRVVAAAGVATVAAVLLQGPERKGRKHSLAREMAVAGATLVPLAVALRGSDLARYHGAEHVSIGEFELAMAGSHDDVAKEHARCGSNLVAPLLLTNAIGNMALLKAFRRPPPGMTLLTGLLALAASMEVFRWMARHPGSPVAKGLAMPGYWLQHFLTTGEPSEAQLEVGRSALSELLRLEGLAAPDPAA
jgi:uncharacterized protein YqhQ